MWMVRIYVGRDPESGKRKYIGKSSVSRFLGPHRNQNEAWLDRNWAKSHQDLEIPPSPIQREILTNGKAHRQAGLRLVWEGEIFSATAPRGDVSV